MIAEQAQEKKLMSRVNVRWKEIAMFSCLPVTRPQSLGVAKGQEEALEDTW